jgi:hypothetical protein
MLDWEYLAKQAANVAGPLVAQANPIAGVLFSWATAVAFEIIDDVEKKNSPIAAAQHAGDRVVDLVEELKLMGH